MSLSHYFPFFAALATTLGIGFFGTIVYAQNGGFITDITQPVREGVTTVEHVEDVPTVSVEQLPLELDEVVIQPTKKSYKTQLPKKYLQVWRCIPHELQQGGLSDAPTVDVCEWVPFKP
jgi:hypothetical protein